MSQSEKPFANLGRHLRDVRKQFKRSLAEVSGAIEIDEKLLRRIEIGHERPDEDVMLLLISYFNVEDQEALKLWELAEYDSDINEHIKFSDEPGEVDPTQLINKSVIMMLSMDVRTMYSDGIDVTVNKAGVTLNFTQAPANKDQKNPISVAKVGLSHTQAEEVRRALEKAILRSRYISDTKLLPPSTNTSL
jgi:hypothetical protein